MPNTLTGLSTTIYESLDRVARELVGFIPAVTINANGSERVAVGQNVTIPVTRVAGATDITPAVTPPNDGDQTVDNITMTITKSRRVPFRWNGEERRALNVNGASYNAILADQMTQAMRTLVNEIENDLAGLYVAASRAYGTAGTTPFVSDLSDTANMLKILLDNGCPRDDLNLIIGTTAGVNLRKQAQLTKVNEAGSDALVRRGVLLDLHGFAIRESAAVRTHTKGTGTSYVSSGSTAPGVTDIALITGSGTVLAGDVVTFAADSINKYVVNTGVAAPGTISLGKPGARVTIPTSNALTVGNNYTANLAFHRSALTLLQRAPALPEGGDSADDRMTITDPVSGLSFELSVYRQYRQVQFEVAMAWGVKCTKSEFLATLLG